MPADLSHSVQPRQEGTLARELGPRGITVNLIQLERRRRVHRLTAVLTRSSANSLPGRAGL
ncbi:hypothetical protein A9W99_18355 [Mycobacterium sp. 1164966.3]|nr:hypothetical protein A9W99_18355 [Mycobacterium sp. 1164966.3]